VNKLRLIASAALLLSSGLALAQSTPDLGRAQKQADNVFRWIKVHAERPAAAPAAAPAPVAQAAVKRTAPAPAAAPVRVASAGNASPLAAVSSAAAATAASPEAMLQANPTAAGYAADSQPANTAYTSSAPASAGATQYAPSQAQPAVEVPASSAVAETPSEPALNLIKRVDPELPAGFELNERGFAQISFTVEPDGRVSNANILKASIKRLGYAAAEAVRQWRFEPVKTAQHVAVQIEFAPE
jgi:TonB family protein